MKTLLAIAVVMLFTAFATQAQDNCTATATGTFTFSVEQAIGLTPLGNNEFALGGICPGCNKDFENACAGWTVTGGEDCIFHAAMGFTSTPDLPTSIVVSSAWQYMDEAINGWENFPASDHPGDIFWIDNGNASFGGPHSETGPTSFQVCVTNIATTCNDVAASYTLNYTLTVNYVCSL